MYIVKLLRTCSVSTKTYVDRSNVYVVYFVCTRYSTHRRERRASSPQMDDHRGFENMLLCSPSFSKRCRRRRCCRRRRSQSPASLRFAVASLAGTGRSQSVCYYYYYLPRKKYMFGCHRILLFHTRIGAGE